MIRRLATIISCFALLSTAATVPALAEVKDAASAAVTPSNLDGVVWNENFTTCTLQSGHSVDAQALTAEIYYYGSALTTFKAEPNTSLTGRADRLFRNCIDLSTVDLASSFDTSGVTDMSEMFSHCSSLTSLTLPDAFDTHEVTDMEAMFDSCSSLTSLTLPESFDTSLVENMEGMFYSCSALTSLTLPSNLNTGNVRSMSSMFLGCSQLEELNLSMTSSEKLSNCSGMFVNCINLKELNLGNFVPPTPTGQADLCMFADVNLDTGEIYGSLPSIEKITMPGACILGPGEGTSLPTASGTFFDYKEPLSWSAYYHSNTAGEQVSTQGEQNSLSVEPDAVLTGFDEFKAYQETHPGLTTYIFDEQPTPPGPTPEPTPDVTPASDTDALPLTSDISASVSCLVPKLLAGGLAFTAACTLRRKRAE